MVSPGLPQTCSTLVRTAQLCGLSSVPPAVLCVSKDKLYDSRMPTSANAFTALTLYIRPSRAVAPNRNSVTSTGTEYTCAVADQMPARR